MLPISRSRMSCQLQDIPSPIPGLRRTYSSQGGSMRTTSNFVPNSSGVRRTSFRSACAHVPTRSADKEPSQGKDGQALSGMRLLVGFLLYCDAIQALHCHIIRPEAFGTWHFTGPYPEMYTKHTTWNVLTYVLIVTVQLQHTVMNRLLSHSKVATSL